MSLTPVVLFVYNRPDHTRQTVEALRKNEQSKDSDFFIFSDAPKKPEAVETVREVRKYIRTINGFRSVNIIERDRNLGLANSVIDGVTRLCNEYGKVIVLEDDLVTSPYFLHFMNQALERYWNEPQVMQISGYMFPVEVERADETFFMPFTTSWGWATWQRAWEHFNHSEADYQILKKDRDRRKAFDLGGAHFYYKMLESQLRGEIDSWAIRWYLCVFMRQGLVLYPPRTLVENIGFDGSGTHRETRIVAKYHTAGSEDAVKTITFPERVAISRFNYKAAVDFMQISTPKGILDKLKGVFR